MRLLIGNNPVPSTIDLKYSDEPFTLKSVSDNGAPVSSTWTLTFDPEFMYSENLGSFSSTPFIYTTTGASATYHPPLKSTSKQSVRQHIILVASDGHTSRTVILTIS